MRHHGVSRLRGHHVRRRGVTGNVATEFAHGNQNAGAGSRNPGEEMAMNEYFHEHAVREHFRKLAAVDQQLSRWGWFQRNEQQSHASAWRVQVGQQLIRLGCWLQGDSALPARTSKEA